MKKLLAIFALSLTSLVYPVTIFAQNVVNLSPTDTKFANLPKYTIPNLISTGISIILIVAALLFFFMLVIGGIRWIMSAGEKGNVENARKQITNALIGLAVVFVAWAILRLIGSVFGIADITTFTIPTIPV